MEDGKVYILMYMYWAYFVIDIQPPVVNGCPDNVQLNATESTALYSWTPPVFTDPMGTELNITSSHDTSIHRFNWGDHTVSYTATKPLNGLQTTCSFNVTVRREYIILFNRLAFHAPLNII